MLWQAASTESKTGNTEIKRVISKTSFTRPCKPLSRRTPPCSCNLFALRRKEPSPALLRYFNSEVSTTRWKEPSSMHFATASSNFLLVSASIRPINFITTILPTLLVSMIMSGFKSFVSDFLFPQPRLYTVAQERLYHICQHLWKLRPTCGMILRGKGPALKRLRYFRLPRRRQIAGDRRYEFSGWTR